MANVRILYDDAAERATITAGAGQSANGYDPNSLKINTKSLAHRSSGTSITYTLTWSSDEAINGIILPATNLSSASTIAVTAKNSTGTSVYTHNSGTAVSACTNTTLDSFPGIKNVNSFPYGGLSKTAIWFTNTTLTNIRSLEITLNRGTDPTANPAYPSYIDCSRIICGKYWEPVLGVSKDGLDLTIADTTQLSRSDTGDLYTDRGTIHDELTFNLSLLTKTDKEELVKIFKYVGGYRNLAISIFPEGNNRNEQDYIIYGKRETSGISYIVHNYFSNSFSITGW
jgi:hypothetical protein